MNELSKVDMEETEEQPIFDAAELGAMLREARQAMDRDIKDVAQELRIRRPYLEAIEDGRLIDLPGPAYTTGFLRSYSNYLGLDAEDIVDRFKQAGIDIEKRTNLHMPSPVEEGRLPTGSLFMVAIALAGVIYAAVYLSSSDEREALSGASAIPAEFSSMTKDARGGKREGSDGEAPATTPKQPVKSDAVAAAPEASGETAPPQSPRPAPSASPSTDSDSAAPSASTAAAPSTSTPEVATAASSSPPVATEAPKTQAPRRESETVPAVEIPLMPPATATVLPKPSSDAGGPDADPAPQPEQSAALPPSPEEPQLREDSSVTSAGAVSAKMIMVKAIADSWVEIRVADQKPLISKLMREGETFSVDSRPGLVMVTGNAGGIELSVGGATIPKLGPKGKILQNVPIDADTLLARQSSAQ